MRDSFDEDTFTALFRSLYPALVNYASTIIGNKDDAEDSVAEEFSRLFASYADLTLRTTVRAYLFSAVRNRALKQLRAQRREGARYERGRHDDAPAVVQNPPQLPDEVMMARDDTRRAEAQAKALFERLSPVAREVVRLRLSDGLSHAEIAEVLGMSVDAVKAQFSRAIRMLRELFPDQLTVTRP